MDHGVCWQDVGRTCVIENSGEYRDSVNMVQHPRVP